MNQSQIHPALRQNSLSSPPKPQSQHYQDGVPPAYSPLQPSPNHSYQSVQTPSYYSNNPHAQDSPEEQSPAGNPSDPNDLKRPRACEACRQLKVKCEPDDNSPTGSCKRCAKAHRQCVVTVPSRKRQKKTDSRVAELEKKIDALTATLAARGGTEADVALDPAISQAHTHPQSQQRPSVYAEQWPPNAQHHGMHTQSPPNPAQIAGVKRKNPDGYEYFGGELQKPTTTSYRSEPPLHSSYNEPRQKQASDESPYIDVIDRGIIDMKLAWKCFDRYVAEMCKMLPIVVFQPGVKAEEIRKTKPILFLAIIGVACGTIRPGVQSKLISEATRILADRIVYTGEKSMELVQTIQVMTVFYQPPEKYEELNFNQLIHIAAVMAFDIGMGKRSKKGAFAMWKPYMEKNKAISNPDAAETRRCWLGCYYMCSNSSMSLRRPLLVRWSLYADESIEILKTAQDALPSDQWLCQLVQAQHIAETIGVEFSMDDPASPLSLTDPTIQYHLKALEQELAAWRDAAGSDMMESPIMQHTEAIMNLYMHEIAMHHEHNIDDFRPPYHTTPIEGPPDPDSVTPAHIRSLTTCLHSAHAAFEAFLSMDVKMLRSLPTHFFVRNSYAAVALIKLYSAVAAKGSKFGSIFKTEDLKVDSYLDRLIATLTQVAEGGMSKVAYKFSLIFNMLKNWHLRRTESPNGSGSREQSQHRMPARAQIPQGYKPTPSPQHSDQSNMWAQGRGPMDQNAQAHSQRSGLQMLSDAAMNPGRGPPPQQALAQQQGQWMPPPQQQQQQMGQLQPLPGIEGMAGVHGGHDPSMMAAAYGMQPGDQMAMMDFTSDELMAYGFGDEFMAMNFGFDQGGTGWAI